MSIVEIKNLNKAYPSFRLQDVSFDIREGEITGFVGRNGAGKTTVIKSMLGLVHPDSGEIRFFGKPLCEDETGIRQLLGYSTGQIMWYPRKKLGDILGTVKRFYPSWDETACRRYMERFCLDENKTVMQLSDGMKVKFNLMIALSHHARVLILDEPTSGLDPFSRDELLSLFDRLKEEGTTVFFSTHIVSDIEKHADRIVFISGGRIAADHTHGDFITRYSQKGENLEDTILRLEREESHA